MLAYRTMAQDVRPMDCDERTVSTPTDNTTPAATSTILSSVSTDRPSDNVSSLRALALSTLRPKRKKEGPGVPSVPTRPLLHVRPPAPDSNGVLLDYGSEAKEDQDEPAAPAASTERTSDDKPTILETTVDAEVKEEGEISDEEPRASSIASSSSLINNVKSPYDYGSGKATLIRPSGISSIKPAEADHQSSPSSPEQYSRRSSTASQDRDLWNNWVPSEDHVRPGLKMTLEQFNLAKELVLDLLGWGVSPEYLVDCGLTRESVFYTFMELNLRLPQNLDVTGLLPSPPENVAQNPAQLSNDNDGAAPSNLPTKSEPSPIHARRPSLSHPLPAKPQAKVASVISPVTPAVAASQAHPNGQNLSDMEAQRRQQLQARKAALASRRKKTMPASSGESSVPGTSAVAPSTVLEGSIVDEPMPIAPSSAVDDFLKNMMETTTSSSSHSSTPAPAPKARTLSGGVSLGLPLGANAISTPSKKSPVTPTFRNSMDVDLGGVPGLKSTQSVPVRSESPVASSSGSSEAVGPRSSRRTSIGLTPPVVTLPERRSKAPPVPASRAPVQPTNGRRGTKRPVAMDFVDVEHNPASSQTDTYMSNPPPFIRRKLAGGGFAGLLAHFPRRCVIDVSDDSEDDEREEITNESQPPVNEQATTSVNPNMPGAIPSTTPALRPPTTRPTSSLGSMTSKPASPGLPPVALVEKEKQIKQMREMIAQRELERLRKLTEKSRTPAVTPPPSLSTSVQAKGDSILTTAPFSPKTEESDTIPLPTSATSEPVSRPSRSESSSTSIDQADEDIVMQALEASGSTSDSALPTPTGSIPRFTTTAPISRRSRWNIVTLENLRKLKKNQGQDSRSISSVLDKASASEDSVLAMPVDVANPDTSSAQAESPQDNFSLYSAYHSPFSSYPLLRSRSRVVADLASDYHWSSSTSLASPTSALSSSISSTLVASKVTIPDLCPLRVAVMSREAGGDSGRRICQFEVPGGGECRDQTCTDLHVGDLEPDDHETARYLLETMPDILQAYNESEIADQLLQARQKKPGLGKTSTQSAPASLEDRVAEAITALVGSGR